MSTREAGGARLAGALAGVLGLHPLAARALAARGLADPVLASRFLSPRLEDLPDPFTMKGMEGAVARIVRAVEEGQRIACYGDYDVDGVTSTVLLSGFLGAAGGVVTHLHPPPAGGGLRPERRGGGAAGRPGREPHRHARLRHHQRGRGGRGGAAGRGRGGGGPPHRPGGAAGGQRHPEPAPARLRLPLEAPRRGGRDLQPGHGAPQAAAGAGPLRRDPPRAQPARDARPGRARHRGRRGAARRGEPGAGPLRPRRAGKGPPPGVRALLRVAGVATGEVTASQVGFRLAPRVNAAGRLDDAGRGVRLLSTTDPAAADALAEELDRENRARQEIERQMLEEALADAARLVAAGARGLVLSRPGWHPGVVGIVASRVVERFHRPAVLVGVSDGVGKGSGRSIAAFHLHDALAACAGHLTRFGGHRHAAGVTIDPAAIPAFREAFEAPRRLGPRRRRPRPAHPHRRLGGPARARRPGRDRSREARPLRRREPRAGLRRARPPVARAAGGGGRRAPEARAGRPRRHRLPDGGPAAALLGTGRGRGVAGLRRLGRDAAAPAPGPRPAGGGVPGA